MLLLSARKKLKTISDSPALDADLLLSHCIKKNRIYLHTWPEKQLSKEQIDCFNSFIEMRENDFPVAYILGSKPFWTLNIIVNPDVLIPRPETELLVELALEKIKTIEKPKILDLGTGSGAISLAIASERKDSQIIATDNSLKALTIAKKNAQILQLHSQIDFIHSNWYSNISTNNFDLIVSNPPYIDKNDHHLQLTIKHEPREALVAKKQGMYDIETIIKQGKPFLKKNAWLIIEHGYSQGDSTLKCFKEHHYAESKTNKDLNELERVSLARKK